MALTQAERADLIERYASGPLRLREAIIAAPVDALQWKSAPDQFSIHEVAVHCADACAVGYGRIRFILAESDPPIPGWDEEAWARNLAYERVPIEAALATVEATVAATVPLFEGLAEEAWARTGRHSGAGIWSADDWLAQHGTHNDLHVAHVDEIVAAWQTRDEVAK